MSDKIIYEGGVVDVKSKKPLEIFKTYEDRFGNDIALMSNFFDGYVQQMTLAIKEQSDMEVVKQHPVVDFGILSEVIHRADIIMKGNITLLPDFDNLPPEIKTKLKKGIYTLGESKQVDGNLRAVILDENGTRVKDITLKKVFDNPGNIETVRSIGNQMQMRQIYTKLADIQEIQSYQLEKDRERDIAVPFLNARSLVIEAETKVYEEERVKLLKEADGEIRGALNAIYADIETTSKRFARRVSVPILPPGSQVDTYMRFLTEDLQIATKYVGVRMQLLEYLGETETAKLVLLKYQHVVHDFLTKPVTRKGLSTVALMHDYFSYDKSNMNFWYTFSKEMVPALESSMKTLQLDMHREANHEVYIVSMEDVEYAITEEE